YQPIAGRWQPVHDAGRADRATHRRDRGDQHRVKTKIAVSVKAIRTELRALSPMTVMPSQSRKKNSAIAMQIAIAWCSPDRSSGGGRRAKSNPFRFQSNRASFRAKILA